MKILIKGGLALLFDGQTFKVEFKDILVEGNEISKIAEPGSISESELKDQDLKVINAEGKLVMPGLINAHTHAYMSLFRNYADDRDFWDWLAAVQKVEEDMTEEDCYWGTLLNAIEMIKTGTTCFVDMNIKTAKKGHTTGPLSSCSGAANDAGMRAVITRGLSGNANDEDSLVKFGRVLDEIETFKGNDRVRFWFGPHAPYSCMADYLQKLTNAAKEHGAGITIHLSESTGEVENMLKEHGVTPIKYVADLGVFDVPVIAAHCVQANMDDIKLMKEKGVSVAMNPKSNMKLGNGFMPAEEFLNAGVNLCLGTDGCGSNNTQNLFAEMNAAALIYKGDKQKAECISAEDVLKFATVNGAKAIGMEGKLGILKEGALADIILLNLNEPEFYPMNNLVSALVYSATGREVETVIIDGNLVMEENKLLTIDSKEVYAECEKIAERLNMRK